MWLRDEINADSKFFNPTNKCIASTASGQETETKLIEIQNEVRRHGRFPSTRGVEIKAGCLLKGHVIAQQEVTGLMQQSRDTVGV